MSGLKRWAVLLLTALLMLPCAVTADVVSWPQKLTTGQEALRQYIEAVDAELMARNQPPVNNLMEIYPTLAVLAVTDSPEAEESQGIELEFALSTTGIASLILRVTEPARFAALAAGCISVCSGGSVPYETALKTCQAVVDKVSKDPDTSFSSGDPDLAQGGDARVYWRYEPKRYPEGDAWLIMTLVFPALASGDVTTVTPPPEKAETAKDGFDSGYVGYDDYNAGANPDNVFRFEVFVSPTPEPDFVN